MHTHQFFTWTTHTAETTTLLEATRLQKLYIYMCNIVTEFYLYSIVYIYLINSRLDVTHSVQGQIQDLIRGGPQIVTGLKLPFWGLSFVEFWCWGLIFGGQGGPGPPGPPGSAPGVRHHFRTIQTLSFTTNFPVFFST